MREILFKAKRMDNGEWVEGDTIVQCKSDGKKMFFILPNGINGTAVADESGNVSEFSGFLFYKVYPETVCQYTGLTDKNGVKIFEGDKLSVSKGEPYEKNGFAKIVSACWIIEFSDSWDFLDNVKIVSEVVGNIHDKE